VSSTHRFPTGHHLHRRPGRRRRRIPGDVVQVAGYCAGVGERAGLPQAVYLDKEITLRGGYNPGDWSVCDPLATLPY